MDLFIGVLVPHTQYQNIAQTFFFFLNLYFQTRKNVIFLFFYSETEKHPKTKQFFHFVLKSNNERRSHAQTIPAFLSPIIYFLYRPPSCHTLKLLSTSLVLILLFDFWPIQTVNLHLLSKRANLLVLVQSLLIIRTTLKSPSWFEMRWPCFQQNCFTSSDLFPWPLQLRLHINIKKRDKSNTEPTDLIKVQTASHLELKITFVPDNMSWHRNTTHRLSCFESCRNVLARYNKHWRQSNQPLHTSCGIFVIRWE